MRCSAANNPAGANAGGASEFCRWSVVGIISCPAWLTRSVRLFQPVIYLPPFGERHWDGFVLFLVIFSPRIFGYRRAMKTDRFGIEIFQRVGPCTQVAHFWPSRIRRIECAEISTEAREVFTTYVGVVERRGMDCAFVHWQAFAFRQVPQWLLIAANPRVIRYGRVLQVFFKESIPNARRTAPRIAIFDAVHGLPLFEDD